MTGGLDGFEEASITDIGYVRKQLDHLFGAKDQVHAQNFIMRAYDGLNRLWTLSEDVLPEPSLQAVTFQKDLDALETAEV